MLAGFFALFIRLKIVAKAMATAPNCHSEEQSDVGIP